MKGSKTMKHQKKLIRKAFLEIIISFIGFLYLMVVWALPEKRRKPKQGETPLRGNPANAKFIKVITHNRFRDLPSKPVIY